MTILIKHRALLIRLGQIIVIAISLLFLAVTFSRNWAAIANSTKSFNQQFFVVALAILFIGWGLLPFPTYTTLRAFSVQVSWPQAMAAFHSSQAMKYLPGGIWAFPGRALIYSREHHLDSRKSAFAVTWETLMLLIAAIFISVAGIALNIQFTLTTRILALATLILLAIPLLIPSQYLITFCNQFTQLKIANFLSMVVQISAKVSLKSIAVCSIFWLINGTGFYYLLTSVLGDSLPYSWYEATAIYAIAWTISFLVIVAPAGLGVRESVLVFLLSPAIEQGNALFVAILARLWWTLAEGGWIIIGTLLYYYAYKK